MPDPSQYAPANLMTLFPILQQMGMLPSHGQPAGGAMFQPPMPLPPSNPIAPIGGSPTPAPTPPPNPLATPAPQTSGGKNKGGLPGLAKGGNMHSSGLSNPMNYLMPGFPFVGM